MNTDSRRRPALDWPWQLRTGRVRRLVGALVGRVPTPQTVLGGLALAWMVLLTEADGAASDFPAR